MTRLTVLGLAIAATMMSPARGLAQRHADHAPFPGYERDDRDLGTWDALVTAHDGHGRPLTARFVETNSRGCGGTCVQTRLDSLTPLTRFSTPGPWWTVLRMGPGVGARPSDLDGAARLDSASAFANPPVVALVATATGSKAVLVDPTPTRISVEHPLHDRRVVTLFGQTAGGTEVQLLRIGYTRREPTRRSSR
jgi:hypothetical protein